MQKIISKPVQEKLFRFFVLNWFDKNKTVLFMF